MNTKLVALAGILPLGLIASAALAQDDPIRQVYADSYFGVVQSGVIKEPVDCPPGTDYLAKNVNPFLSGGSTGGGEWFETFLIDGSAVTLYVEWIDDNSFRYEVQNGIMKEIGVTVDNDKLVYKYGSAVVSDGTPAGEGWLNVLLSGQASAKVNHVDACLSLLDTSAPTITFNSPPTPAEGAAVSGVVTIEVTVFDESGVDRESVSVSIAGESFAMQCTPATAGGTEYVCRYDWDTSLYATGLYELAVIASDLAEPTRNVSLVPKTIELEAVRIFTDCFGTLGDEGDLDPLDPTEPDYTGGCMPTREMRVQVPPDTQTCAGDNPPITCYIAGTLLKPNRANVDALFAAGDCPAASGNPVDGYYCGDGFPDCRMAQDANGAWYPKDKQDLDIFTDIGIDPAQEAGVLAAVQAAYPTGSAPPASLDGALVLDQDTYGANGCFVVTQHFKGYIPTGGGAGGTELNVLYPTWPQNPATGLFFIKSHFPKSVLPLSQVASCYVVVEDLQITAGAGYQPLFQSADDTGYVGVRTIACKNPLLKSSRNNGFDVSNIIVSTAGADYVDTATNPIEVLRFMYQENEEDFARLFALIDIINRDSLLLTGNFNRDVQSPINQAKRRFDNFNPKSLQQSIDSLHEAVDGIRTKTTYLVTEANPPGELLSVTYHLIWDLGLLRDELIRVEALP